LANAALRYNARISALAEHLRLVAELASDLVTREANETCLEENVEK
jgi:hypothetical protein